MDQWLENCLGVKCFAWTQAILYIQDKIKPLGHAVPCPLVPMEQSVWSVNLPPQKFKIARALRELLMLAPNTFYSAFSIMAKTLLYLDRRKTSIIDRRNTNIYIIQSIALGNIFRVVAFEKEQLWALIIPHLTREN